MYLQNQLQYKGLVLPDLPAKKSIGNTDPGFIKQRRHELERYLQEISRHDVFYKERMVSIFLGNQKEGDFNSIKERNPMTMVVSLDIDWKKVKDQYEYALASLKSLVKGSILPSEVKKLSS
mmetsp:Transcript_3331/g.2884  ORF Transcript_3331/g.2884 Transcript_3331/m.2884 type:complete len:121 (+) Transcript_3331:1175-1537(+)